MEESGACHRDYMGILSGLTKSTDHPSIPIMNLGGEAPNHALVGTVKAYCLLWGSEEKTMMSSCNPCGLLGPTGGCFRARKKRP